MPRQNRVTPYGAIIAAPERGLFMGNRWVGNFLRRVFRANGRLEAIWPVIDLNY